MSSDADIIYEKQNTNNKRIVKLAFTSMSLGNVILHSVPAICPFLYMMFSFPSPKFWLLALDVDKA